MIDTEEAYTPDIDARACRAMDRMCCSTRPSTGGRCEEDFAAADRSLTLRVTWGRSSTVPIETFGVVAEWDPWSEVLDVWASIQMPKYADQIARALRLPGHGVRVHYDVDVGGSYGVKRGIKHTVLVGSSGARAEPAGATDRRPAGEYGLRRRARTRPHFRRRRRVQQRRYRQVDEDARARQRRAPMQAAHRFSSASRLAPSSGRTRSTACAITRYR